MTYVVGADFGTLSVRVTLMDCDSGATVASVSEGYPLHRNPADPLMARQAHVDHMASLLRLIPPGQVSWWSMKTCSHWLTITFGPIIPPMPRPKKSQHWRGAKDWKHLTGAVAHIPTNGATPNCCISCATIRTNAIRLRPPLNIATW